MCSSDLSILPYLQAGMRILVLLALLTVPAFGQDIEIQTRPDSVFVETLSGNLTPIERVFFHIVLHNKSTHPVDIQVVRFNLVNSGGVLLSGQYSGNALSALFDSAIERRRIEPTTLRSFTIQPDQRKAISDVFIDCPLGFIGESLLVEVDFTGGGASASQKSSTPLTRSAGFSGRLPFDGSWYVSAEHGFQDAHKRFLAEADRKSTRLNSSH